VLVPVLPEDLDPWYRLGFHQMHVAAGITETSSEPAELPDGVSIREAGIEDLDDIVRIDVLIFEHQRGVPRSASWTARPTWRIVASAGRIC
jgi:hypothetical protein